MNNSDFLKPIPHHFVSFAQRYLAACCFFASHAVQHADCMRPGFWFPVSRPVFRLETSGPPRFLGNPCARAPLCDPGVVPAWLALQTVMLPSARPTASARHKTRISGLYHAAHALAVYASRRRSLDTTQDSLPAGCPPWPGGTFTHGIPIEFRCS